MKRIDPLDPDMGQDFALVTPVDLGLSTRNHLEPRIKDGVDAWRSRPLYKIYAVLMIDAIV
ncbi:hypothetical protein [Streptomyces sp. NPDC001665]